MTDLLTMAAQMVLCCVVIGGAALGIMWLIFSMTTWWERKG